MANALRPLLWCRVRRARAEGKNPKSCDETFERLITEGVDPDDLYHEVTHQVSSGARMAPGGQHPGRNRDGKATWLQRAAGVVKGHLS